MRGNLVIGTRASRLALAQTDEVAAMLRRRWPSLAIDVRRVASKGDRILDTPLAQIGGKGLFTSELDALLLAGEIDAAVHSLKDVPTALPRGLVLAATPARQSPLDALLSPRYHTLAALPQGATVGTSSLRRGAQVSARRPDLRVVNLRGNVNTRLARLDAGDFDAIILAQAGLLRLGLAGRVTELLPLATCLPAVGQGALAVVARADAVDVRDLLSPLHDLATWQCVSAERAVLATLGGGCQTPVAAHAALAGDELTVQALIASTDGAAMLREAISGQASEAATLGRTLAERLLAAGGRALLPS